MTSIVVETEEVVRDGQNGGGMSMDSVRFPDRLDGSVTEREKSRMVPRQLQEFQPSHLHSWKQE